MADPVTLKLRGAPLPPQRLPRLLQDTHRAAGLGEDDPFLPRGLISVDQAFDLSATARSTDAGQATRDVQAATGQVVVLELPEGVTVITHPENLREAVRRIDPSALEPDGSIAFDR